MWGTNQHDLPSSGASGFAEEEDFHAAAAAANTHQLSSPTIVHVH
jgi:hypothetical protein